MIQIYDPSNKKAQSLLPLTLSEVGQPSPLDPSSDNFIEAAKGAYECCVSEMKVRLARCEAMVKAQEGLITLLKLQNDMYANRLMLLEDHINGCIL